MGSDPRQLAHRRRSARAGTDRTGDVGFLLSVARSRYLDSWRRQRRLQRKLRLVWAGARDPESAELSAGKVLDHLSACSAEHRVVLMLAYVDDIPIADIAEMLGSSVSSTYSLLHVPRRASQPPHRGSDMTDHFDEMRVAPDPLLAEALRQRLHARMASVALDHHEVRSHLQLDAARLVPEQDLVPVEGDRRIRRLTDQGNQSPSPRVAAAVVVAVLGAVAIVINLANSEDDGPSPVVATVVLPTASTPTTLAIATTTEPVGVPGDFPDGTYRVVVTSSDLVAVNAINFRLPARGYGRLTVVIGGIRTAPLRPWSSRPTRGRTSWTGTTTFFVPGYLWTEKQGPTSSPGTEIPTAAFSSRGSPAPTPIGPPSSHHILWFQHRDPAR